MKEIIPSGLQLGTANHKSASFTKMFELHTKNHVQLN